MRVQRLVMPGSGVQSWTLLGDDLAPVVPAERFLAYLASIDRSPNTVRAYAHDLKDWFVFLAGRGVEWRSVTLEDVGAFAGWLRLPPAGRDGRVAVLPSAVQRCGGSSVNRKLAALTSFCEFHARHGEPLGGLLVRSAPPGRGNGSSSSFKPFLHHISKSGPQRRRTVTVPAVTPTPQVLAVAQVQAILDACQHLRDRLLFGLMLDTGLRVGEVLGLRHEDLMIAERQVLVVPRRNDNGARAKSGRRRTVPTNVDVMRLYADYLNTEYGALDSDYVFVNLFGQPHGQPLTYAAVYDLVRRLRCCTGITFGPHMFRHTYATWLFRRGAGMESVKELLGHASITTTVDTYGHLSVEDARRALETAGWFTGREVLL